GEPEEVTRYSEYRTPDGVPGVNVSASSPEKENSMARKEQVDQLIANTHSGGTVEDRTEPTEMKEAPFKKVLANAAKATELASKKQEEKPAKTEETVPEPTPAPTKPAAAKKPVTANE